MVEKFKITFWNNLQKRKHFQAKPAFEELNNLAVVQIIQTKQSQRQFETNNKTIIFLIN